jgi:predicted alpha-1,2-mannosidase
MRVLRLLVLLVVVPMAVGQSRLGLVDPLVGSLNGGNTTPGAQVPFGFVSLGPDSAGMDHGFTNGYNPGAEIIGFSYTHESGTGGEAKYGNFRVTPTVGEMSPQNLIFPWTDERATPGYYAVTLGVAGRQVLAEHTATRLVGYSRYSFEQRKQANVILDVSARLRMQGGRSGVPSVPQYATAAKVTLTDARHAEGSVAVTGGWNPAPYTLYFAAEFDRPAAVMGIWEQHGREAAKVFPGRKHGEGGDQTPTEQEAYRNQMGAYFSFDTAASSVVQMRLAVSFVSVEKARQNLAAEAGMSFDAVKQQAERQWSQVLGTIDVDGGTEAQRSIFYTALYRAHVMPHDLTGENVWWSSTQPHYEDFYTLWDTFRTLHPLFTLIEPQRQAEMVNSLLDTYAHTGWLPDARIAGANGLTQGGSNGDIVLADAVVKRLPGVDANVAYAAAMKDATVNVSGERSWYEGRQLTEYERLGYMSLNEQRSASRTLEYAADDFSAATIAHATGHEAEAQRLLARSGSWKNLWDKELHCIRPRYADGRWLENYSCEHLYPDGLVLWWDTPFYEGSSAQYSTYVPQDFAGLIAELGGSEAATRWLDTLFDKDLYTQGNEPDMLAPYTYIYTGRQDRTAERVRGILATQYKTGRGGIPGNDDAGTLSSWYLWSSFGLYPVAGQPLYLIGSPVFPRTVLHVAEGKSFTISAVGTSDAALYVQSATLNGRPLQRAWLKHDEVVAGGELRLQMGLRPARWDTEPPPSGASVWR